MPRPAVESLTREQRDMRHGVRQIQKEWFLLMLLDEVHRPLGVAAGELMLVRHQLGNLVSLDERKRRIVAGLCRGVERPHVVAVGEPEILIEALVDGQELRRTSEMPFAEHPGGVALSLQQLGERHLIGVQRHLRLRR